MLSHKHSGQCPADVCARQRSAVGSRLLKSRRGRPGQRQQPKSTSGSKLYRRRGLVQTQRSAKGIRLSGSSRHGQRLRSVAGRRVCKSSGHRQKLRSCGGRGLYARSRPRQKGSGGCADEHTHNMSCMLILQSQHLRCWPLLVRTQAFIILTANAACLAASPWAWGVSGVQLCCGVCRRQQQQQAEQEVQARRLQAHKDTQLAATAQAQEQARLQEVRAHLAA